MNPRMKKLKELWAQFYLAEDGLGLLFIKNTRGPFPGHTLGTADNDNGIIFAALGYWLGHIHEVSYQADKVRFQQTMKRLRLPSYTGYFLRNPGRVNRHESHDNYAAIVSLSVLFETGHAAEIAQEGMRNGFIFNTVNPGEFRVRSWRQGSEVSFYKICGSTEDEPMIPTMWEFGWMIGAIITNAFQGKNRGSEHQNAWLRIRALNKKFKESDLGSWGWMDSIFSLARWFWNWKLKRKTAVGGMHGIGRIMASYFHDDEHPLPELGDDIYG